MGIRQVTQTREEDQVREARGASGDTEHTLQRRTLLASGHGGQVGKWSDFFSGEEDYLKKSLNFEGLKFKKLFLN